MATQKFTGKNQLIDRLAAQVGSKESAKTILKKRGDMNVKGELTKAGKVRDAMTAKERAINRESTRSGNKLAAYKYDPRTNRATLRKKS
jgi:ribosomal protein S30